MTTIMPVLIFDDALCSKIIQKHRQFDLKPKQKFLNTCTVFSSRYKYLSIYIYSFKIYNFLIIFETFFLIVSGWLYCNIPPSTLLAVTTDLQALVYSSFYWSILLCQIFTQVFSYLSYLNFCPLLMWSSAYIYIYI